jgi:hypothetical protein
MTAQTRKWVHAGLVALASSTADLGAQLATGSVSLTRAALVGLGLGVFSRVLGAVLAALAMPDKSSGGAALIFFALLLSPGAAQAQSPIRVDPVEQRSMDRQHMQAETRCGFAHPYPEQLRHLTAEQAAENSVHEAVHLRQLNGNCDSVMAVWDHDLLKRVQAEAEATCEGWKAGNVPRSLWHARSVRAAAWWARFTTVGYEAAIAAFDHWCSS